MPRLSPTSLLIYCLSYINLTLRPSSLNILESACEITTMYIFNCRMQVAKKPTNDTNNQGVLSGGDVSWSLFSGQESRGSHLCHQETQVDKHNMTPH